MTFLNSDTGDSWQAGLKNTNRFFVNTTLTGNTDFTMFPDGAVQFGSHFKLSPSGNLKIAGKLTEGSSRTTKEDFVEVDGGKVLSLLEELPISRWSYKTDANGTSHMGPMAEDFYAAFGLGEDAQHLAPMDAAAVALVAVKEQQELLLEKDRQIGALQDRLAALEELVSRELGARPASLAR